MQGNSGKSTLLLILDRPADRLALGAIGITAAIASIAEATVLVTITLVGLRLAGDDGVVVDLPFSVPFDELSNSRLIAAGFVLLLLRLSVVGLNSWLGARLSESTMFRWRKRVVDAYLGASWERQQAEEEGHLQTVTQSWVAAVSTVVQQVASALTSGTSFLTFVLGAFLLHPLAALGLATFGVVLFAIVRPLNSFVHRMARRQKTARQEYARLLGEMVTMPQEAQTFGIEAGIVQRLDLRLQQFVSSRRRQSIAQKMTPHVFQSLGLVIVLTGLAVASRFEFSDAALIGALVLLLVRSLNYGQTFQSTLQSVISAQPAVQGLLSAVAEYEDSTLKRGSVQVEEFSKITFAGASLGYSGEAFLKNVDIEIHAGESIGIIGSSGSGKSTLAAALLGLLQPLDGALTVDGMSMADLSPESWIHLASFVPQEPRLFDATVADNIAFFRTNLSDETLAKAAQDANLSREIKEWGGLDHLVGPRGSRLSGGQRQRVCIARALAGQPALLVLDEPTSALDGESEESITEVLRGLRSRCTMVVIAHRLTTLEFCDRVLLVEGGTVVEIGSGQEIQERDSVRLLIEQAMAGEPD